jgi:exopolysaccharide biosynthesis polyprenyl glycosylphosphotransferase
LLKYYRHLFNFACVLADVVVLVVAFLGAFIFRRDLVPLLSESLAKRPMFGLDQYLPVLFLTGIVMVVTLFAVGVYRQHPGLPLSQSFLKNAKATAFGLFLTLALAFLLKMTFMSRSFLIVYLILFMALSTAARHGLAVSFRKSAQRGKYCRVVVIVGATRQAREVAERLVSRPELGIRMMGWMSTPRSETADDLNAMEDLKIPHLGSVDDLPELMEREVIDGVIFSGDARVIGSMEELFLICEDQGVETLVAANLFPHLTAQVALERLEDLPLLRFTTVPHNHIALFIKRLIDLAVSALSLLLLSPLLALIALAIKAGSKGPVFFVQERMGLNGRRFNCFKFRTMVADAEARLPELEHLNEVDGPVFKIKRDPRVTPIGRLLRKTSLDELPQLWNVLKGEMSLVGPRPPIPSEVERYARWQRRRLSMRPGLTCLWQISGRSNLDFDTWMKLDLQYIDDWSMALDFVILLKTIPAVLSGRGAA